MLRRQLLLLLIALPSLGLLAFLVAVPRLGQELTISLLAEASSAADPVEQASVRRELQLSIEEFRRLNPGVKVQLRVVPAKALVNELTYRSARGLGPDLLNLAGNASVVKDLYQRGFISAVDLSEQERLNIRPEFLALQQLNGKQIAVPLYVLPSLACYNSRKMPVPPAQLPDLIRLSQENHPIGLGSALSDLDWLFSGFGMPSNFSSQNPPNRFAVLQTLRWLRQANLQLHIVFVQTVDELRQGLAVGTFEWIPCYTTWVPMLKEKLGKDLGLALLPAGPVGPSMPRLRFRVWAFGSQSSNRQRVVAQRLVAYSTNVVAQRMVSLQLGTVLPVNPNIALPLRIYPTLAISEKAIKKSQYLTLSQRHRLLHSSILAQPLIDQLLAGVQSPEATTNKLIEVLVAPSGGGKR